MIRTSHFLNLLTPAQKAEYVDLCWDMLIEAYKYTEDGFQSASSPEELINDSFLWKLARKDGQIVACAIYKKKFGRKRIASATDGSEVGKTQLKAIYKEDLTRGWAEVSEKAEATLMKLGGERYIVPAAYAEQLTGKKCEPLEDGIHYMRMLKGKMHRKVIIGTPEGITIDRQVVARVCRKLALYVNR